MSELDVVDVAPLFAADRAARDTTDDAIGSAIERRGGFVVAGMPRSERLDALATTALRFFDLPLAAKHAVASRETDAAGPRVYRGYRSSLRQGAWAYDEMFDIGPRHPFPAPPVAGMDVFAESNAWPEVEPCTGWREAMEQYYALMLDIGTRVMLAAARWAGFDDDVLARHYAEGNSTLRLLNYPLRPDGLTTLSDDRALDDTGGPRIAAAAHTDVAGVSLLWQRDSGLQAQGPDGVWHDVPRTPNSVSVHLGTVLEQMTGGRVRATPHRVLDLGTHRQSVGFFVEPGLGVDIAPPREGHPYGATYGWHLQERFHSMPGFEDLVPAPA